MFSSGFSTVERQFFIQNNTLLLSCRLDQVNCSGRQSSELELPIYITLWPKLREVNKFGREHCLKHLVHPFNSGGTKCWIYLDVPYVLHLRSRRAKICSDDKVLDPGLILQQLSLPGVRMIGTGRKRS